MYNTSYYIFFQAEDGIRDGHVTGVQTCALPIYLIVMGSNCAPETTKSSGGVAASLTEDSPKTTISWVPRIPSMTFITESGSAGMTLSATMASGSSSSTET